ncbi:MAG: 6-phosphogluconolactonase [Acidobacteriota bacterium]|jgi:6-phosphogluconolactonase|nr:6-phosphogluconolactonase [Acidobacteriota bacterium]MDT5261856.1 6-phosphogluconolactonase [Acidobacteriota bacterium]
MQAAGHKPDVKVFDSAEEVARAAARRIVELAKESIDTRGVFSLTLSGGSTPRSIYELLAGEEFRDRVDWPNVHIFFGDERTVAPDHADSNYRMANETLLSRVPIPAENLHRIEGVGDAAANASDYESEMRGFFGDAVWPRLDLVMLGMGDDGHTASLFPGTNALEEQLKWVVANWVEKFDTWRITLSAPALNGARHILFLVTGAGKAERLREVLKGERDPSRLPSQLIQPPDGTLEWYVDRAAAVRLEDD